MVEIGREKGRGREMVDTIDRSQGTGKEAAMEDVDEVVEGVRPRITTRDEDKDPILAITNFQEMSLIERTGTDSLIQLIYFLLTQGSI